MKTITIQNPKCHTEIDHAQTSNFRSSFRWLYIYNSCCRKEVRNRKDMIKNNPFMYILSQRWICMASCKTLWNSFSHFARIRSYSLIQFEGICPLSWYYFQGRGVLQSFKPYFCPDTLGKCFTTSLQILYRNEITHCKKYEQHSQQR